MRTLSVTLLAEQKKPTHRPYVEVGVRDLEQGINRLHWTRLYEGSEPDNHHDIAFDSQGSMHRIRSGANNALYRQKITNPGENSDYSQWTQLASDCAGPCAIAAHPSDGRVYIFYQTTSNVLWKYYSSDYGETWSNAQLVNYAAVLSLAAAWWGNSDIVVCFAATATELNAIVLDTSTQATSQHTYSEPSNHPLLNTYGIGATYATSPPRMCVIFAGKQQASPYNFYALYRTELDSSYHWLSWDYFITAPNGEDVTYEYPDIHLPPEPSPGGCETFQLTAVEKFSGTTAYNRPLTSHPVRGSEFSEMAYTEPKPFLDVSSAYGLRLATRPGQDEGSYWWLEQPNGVWRAPGGLSQTWLEGWTFRKKFTINGSSAGAQANYQMKLIVHKGSGADSGNEVYLNNQCQDDFSDIRFTKSNGETKLDYWIEEYTSGSQATVWVELDSIPTGGANFYLYYGNSDATSESSGLNTFLDFDDFENGTNDWVSYNNGLVSSSTEQAKHDTHSLKVNGNNKSWAGTKRTGLSIPNNRAIVFWHYVSETNQDTAFQMYQISSIKVQVHWDAYGKFQINTPSGWIDVDSYTTGWHKYEYRINFDTSKTKLWIDNVYKGEYANLASATAIDQYRNNGGSPTTRIWYIDTYHVRNSLYANEPTWGTWGKEYTQTKSPFLNLTPDILSLRNVIASSSVGGRGNLVIELDNSTGKYALPGSGDLKELKKRSEVFLNLGYKTSQGNEASPAGVYWIDSWEYRRSPNQSTFTLYCLDGWGLASRWTARFQMRWNQNNVNPKSVWHILSELLSRWGIFLSTYPPKPQSSPLNNLYPDLMVNSGTRGDAALRRLLSMVPDGLMFHCYHNYLNYPVAQTKDLKDDEASSYSYGTDHPILTGGYQLSTSLSRARAIGRDGSGDRIVQDALDWDLVNQGIDELAQDYDPNLDSQLRVQERADAILRTQQTQATQGTILVPANCGQELFDVVTLTDERCGISAGKYRILALETDFNSRAGRYQQKLTLGAP